jgi:hypothetical protein
MVFTKNSNQILLKIQIKNKIILAAQLIEVGDKTIAKGKKLSFKNEIKT